MEMTLIDPDALGVRVQVVLHVTHTPLRSEPTWMPRVRIVAASKAMVAEPEEAIALGHALIQLGEQVVREREAERRSARR